MALVALALLALLSLILVGFYAGLLQAGRWQTDEYQLFFNESRFGLGVLPSRLIYSPRPFSEALIFLYGEAIERLHAPLVAAFLASLWGGFMLAIFLAARNAMQARLGRWLAATTLALIIFAFVLTSSSVTEVFYWPVAAAAYLPTLCAAIVLYFQLAAPMTARRELICAGALCIAAASSEMGAALATGFAFCTLLDAGNAWRFKQGLGEKLRAGAWWIIPACLGVCMLSIVAVVRVHLDERTSNAMPHTGHVFYALAAGIKGLGLDLLSFNEAAGWPSILLALGSRAALALGCAALLAEYIGPGSGINRRHLALAGALAIAAFFSIAAAYHDYGTLCCERQSTVRGGFIDLIFTIGASILLGIMHWQPGRPGNVWLAVVMLGLSLVPVGLAEPKIKTEYALLNWADTARDRSWVSGHVAHTKAMHFYLPPDSAQALIRGTGIGVGTYTVSPQSTQLVSDIGRYFGKPTVIVCQPWQTEKSWFINNKWIPACPPVSSP